MTKTLEKLKSEHTILPEFIAFLERLAKHPEIQRIIPGRIARQQKGSALLRCSISYPTLTGLKLKLSKGATAQEVFIVTVQDQELVLAERILQEWQTFSKK